MSERGEVCPTKAKEFMVNPTMKNLGSSKKILEGGTIYHLIFSTKNSSCAVRSLSAS